MSASLGRCQSGGSRGTGSSNQSVSWQERNLVRLQDTITPETGEFIGQTVETEQPFLGKSGTSGRSRLLPATAGRCQTH